MRIALAVQDFPPHLGGTHVFNLECATRLAARGHAVGVYTWSSGAAEAGADDAALPFEVRRAPLVRGRRGLVPAGLTQALVEWGSEVVLTSGGCRAMSGSVHEAARSLPVVPFVHDIRDKGRVRGFFGRRRSRRIYGFELAARVAANSEYTRSCLLRLGVPRERTAVVHPGIDLDHFRPDREAGARLRREQGLEDRKILLTVARIAHNKGHARVIAALPQLLQRVPELCYAILGQGPLREALEQQARELGVADRVRFLGRVPDARPWYNACDVYVMPSVPYARGLKAGEGFGIAYLEAAACERPVVASSSGGGAEAVLDGETGRLVAPDDDAALAAVLEELLIDSERAERLGRKGREHARSFEWERGVSALESLLKEAVHAPR